MRKRLLSRSARRYLRPGWSAPRIMVAGHCPGSTVEVVVGCAAVVVVDGWAVVVLAPVVVVVEGSTGAVVDDVEVVIPTLEVVNS